MTHILHIIDVLQVGGAQKVIKCFVNEALRHDVNVSVVSLSDITGKIPAEELEDLGISVKAFPASNLIDLKRLANLVRYIRSQDFDIIQTHLTYANILGGLAGRLTGIPVVCTLHTSGNDQSEQDASNFTSPRSRAETLALRLFASRIIAIGESVAQAHSTRIPGKKIDVIVNAIEQPKLINPHECQTRRQQIMCDKDQVLLVSACRFAVVKEIPDLITTFHKVKALHPETKLLLIGDGSERSRIEKLISELKLNQDVILLGRRNDVSEWLQSSDVYVSSSSLEGLPMSILEAMAIGLPVVATSVGDIPTLVLPEMGSLVPSKNPALLATSICNLLDHPERRVSMGEAAREHIAHNYNAYNWFTRIMNLYGEMLGKNGTDLYESEIQL